MTDEPPKMSCFCLNCKRELEMLNAKGGFQYLPLKASTFIEEVINFDKARMIKYLPRITREAEQMMSDTNEIIIFRRHLNEHGFRWAVYQLRKRYPRLVAEIKAAYKIPF